MADLLHARFLSLPLAPNPSPALPASGARLVPRSPTPRAAKLLLAGDRVVPGAAGAAPRERVRGARGLPSLLPGGGGPPILLLPLRALRRAPRRRLRGTGSGILAVTLAVVRMYLGWAYVGNRLLSATVECEESELILFSFLLVCIALL